MTSENPANTFSAGDEDAFRYNFDKNKYIIETIGNNSSVRSKSSNQQNPDLPSKSLAYYLDFYSKKHMILSIENAQNNLYPSLKKTSQMAANQSLLRTNNQLLAKNINDHDFPLKPVKNSNNSYADTNKALFLLTQKSNLETTSHSKVIKQREIEHDFLKFNNANTEYIISNDNVINFKNLSNSEKRQFQKHKHLLTHNSPQAQNSLMDYSKQEDRLTNNKYHYYIKHYLNNTKNQISVNTENTSEEKQSNHSLFNRESNSRKNIKLLTKNNEIIDRVANAFEKDSFLTANTNRTIASLQDSTIPATIQQLSPPKITILKSLKNKLGSASKKKAKVLDLKLDDGAECDSRLSTNSLHETAIVDAYNSESLRINENGGFARVEKAGANELENKSSLSQNKQFLERIQRVYNRKFKTNPNNKVKPNTTEQVIELSSRKSPTPLNIPATSERQKTPDPLDSLSKESKSKNSILSKLSKHNSKNSVHPDPGASQKGSKSNINFKFDSVSTFNSDNFTLNNSQNFTIPRVEFDFSVKAKDPSRLKPLKNGKEINNFLSKIEKLSSNHVPATNDSQSLIVNDFLREIIVENLSEGDAQKRDKDYQKVDSNGFLANQPKSLSVIDLAELDRLPKSNQSSQFRPMRLNDYVKSSKMRQIKKLSKLKALNTNKISEETGSTYTIPSNSAFDMGYYDDAFTDENLTNNCTNSTLTLNSKKRVSFHEEVLETDVNSGSSVYKLLL